MEAIGSGVETMLWGLGYLIGLALVIVPVVFVGFVVVSLIGKLDRKRQIRRTIKQTASSSWN